MPVINGPGLFPEVSGNLLVITAFAAVQRGLVNWQRQFLFWSCICYWWFIVFWRMQRKKQHNEENNHSSNN